MGNIGIKTRGTKMLQIVKGSDLVSGIKQTSVYKVAATTPKIFSGEPIYVQSSDNTGGWPDPEYEWVKTSPGAGSTVYFAFTDSDSFDVIASGKLMGISTLDTFELQTPFFDHSATFKPGDKLTVKAGIICEGPDGFIVVSGTDAPETPEGYTQVQGSPAVNCLTKVTGAEEVCGVVTKGVVVLKGNEPVDLTENTVAASVGPEGYVIKEGTGTTYSDLATVGGPALWTEASGSKYVLQFATARS